MEALTNTIILRYAPLIYQKMQTELCFGFFKIGISIRF